MRRLEISYQDGLEGAREGGDGLEGAWVAALTSEVTRSTRPERTGQQNESRTSYPAQEQQGEGGRERL